jgi:hypothetical protein
MSAWVFRGSAASLVLAGLLAADAATGIVFQTRHEDEIAMSAPEGIGGPTRLTNDPGSDTDPIVCGDRIVFVSDRAGNAGHTDIWLMGLDGAAPVNITPNTPDSSEGDPQCEWSGPFYRILFVSDRDGNQEIDTVLIRAPMRGDVSE